MNLQAIIQEALTKKELLNARDLIFVAGIMRSLGLGSKSSDLEKNQKSDFRSLQAILAQYFNYISGQENPRKYLKKIEDKVIEKIDSIIKGETNANYEQKELAKKRRQFFNQEGILYMIYAPASYSEYSYEEPTKGREETRTHRLSRTKSYRIGGKKDPVNKKKVKPVSESLTPYQKYNQVHKNSNSHMHSKNRTTGTDQEKRKSQNIVPDVRKDSLKKPYKNNVVNKAQSSKVILTPIQMQQIEHDYQIDFNDKRKKTIKGKTNMILTPLKNGQWQLERK